MLRAIENEQFDQLPGGLFNRSFVRQYARALGVDEEIALREYLQAFRLPPEAAVVQRSHAPQAHPSSMVERARIGAAVVVMGVLAIGLGYGAFRLHGYLTTPSAPEDTKSLSAPTVVKSDEETGYPTAAAGEPELPSPGGSVITALSVPPEDQAGRAPITPTAGDPAGPASAEDLRLRIDSEGAVWLSITADGVRQWQGTLPPNQFREVQAAESVRLTVGDAGAVRLTLNGRSLPGLGRPGEVRNLTITARDAAEAAP
jgi:cytoskeleton protein RodZ